MPSTRDPVVVVQPGPGRLPANTVPANALIFPPSGNSDAALQAHITDPVGAHAVSAISQLGVSGETWGVAAGATSTALTRLFQAVNARGMWVLDANPAATADFVGPNSLITAIAAYAGSPSKPVLFLRPGTYNWTDPSAAALDGATIVGGGPNTGVIIQNSSGNMRCNLHVQFENVTITLSGNLVLNGVGGNCSFRKVNLNVTGDVQIGLTSQFNEWEDINSIFSLTATYFDVDGAANRFTNVTNCQFNLNPTADNTFIDGMYMLAGGMKYDNTPALLVNSSHSTIHHVFLSGAIHAAPIANIIEIDGDYNKVSQVEARGITPAAGGNTVFWVSGDNHTVDGVLIAAMSGYLFNLFQVGGGSSTANSNVISNVSIDFTTNQQDDFFLLDGTGNIVTGLEFNNVDAPVAGQHLLRIAGNSNSANEILYNDLGAFAATCCQVVGTNSRVDGINIATVTPGANFKVVEVAATNATVRNVRISSITSLPSTGTLVHISSSASDSHVSNVTVAGLVTPAGKVLHNEGTSCRVTGFDTSALGILQANFALVTVAGTNNTLETAVINGVPSISGATAALVALTGVNMKVSGLTFTNIGTSAAIALSLIQATGDGKVSNVYAEDQVGTTLRFGKGIEVGASSNSHYMEFDNCHIVAVAATNDNVFHALNAPNVVVRDSQFLGRGAGAVASSAVMFVSGCPYGSFTNCVVTSMTGHAGAFPNSAVTLTSMRFVGGDQNPNAGLQLFHGYGYVAGSVVHPLVVRDCYMEYGTSNITPSGGGTKLPVIFFGGQGTAGVSGHGPIVVDGLQIQPSSGLTAQHQDSLLSIADSLALQPNPSSYKRIYVDLKEIQWTGTGSTRGILFTDASVIEITSYASPSLNGVMTRFEDIQVLNMKSSASVVGDQRQAIKVLGGDFYGMVVEGPTTGVHGAQTFTPDNALVDLQNCHAHDVYVGRFNPVKTSTSMLSVVNATVTGGALRHNISGATYNSFVRVANSGDFRGGVSGLDMIQSFAVATTALMEMTGNTGYIKDCFISSAAATAISYILLSSVEQGVVSGNKFIGLGTGAAVELSSSVRCKIINNTFGSEGAASLDTIFDPAVSLGTSSEHNLIQGNHFYWETNGVFNAVNGAASAHRNIVTDNIMEHRAGFPNGGIRIELDGDHNQVTGNTMTAFGGDPGDINIEINGTYNLIAYNLMDDNSGEPLIRITALRNTIIGNVFGTNQGTIDVSGAANCIVIGNQHVNVAGAPAVNTGNLA